MNSALQAKIKIKKLKKTKKTHKYCFVTYSRKWSFNIFQLLLGLFSIHIIFQRYKYNCVNGISGDSYKLISGIVGLIDKINIYKISGGHKTHFSDLSFRHVTTKTWAYSLVFGFFIFFSRQKQNPTKVKSLFEITMGN